jgi:hypothetical protein
LIGLNGICKPTAETMRREKNIQTDSLKIECDLSEHAGLHKLHKLQKFQHFIYENITIYAVIRYKITLIKAMLNMNKCIYQIIALTQM